MKRTRVWFSVAAAATLMLAACTSGTGSPSAGGDLDEVDLQLQWVPQAQFGGYFAARDLGYYEDEGLSVNFVDGGPDVVPQQVGSAPEGPEFTISWVPKVLQAREAESDLVNIAQIFQRAGTLSVAWNDSGITTPEDFAGKKVGVWDGGNELEVVASARFAGLEPGVDFEVVIQPFDMTLLLNAADGCEAGDTDCVDVAEAMIYNEYAQLLETDDPEHRRAVPARGPECHRLQPVRHRHAAGRPVCPGRLAGAGGQRGHRHPLPAGHLPRLDPLPRHPR